MIREEDLQEAIAECHGQRNPNSNTCIKLASYYTILDHIKPEEKQMEIPAYSRGYSYAEPPAYVSETEFGKAVHDHGMVNVLRVTDELMETLRLMQPKLYNAVMRKITAL